MILQYKKQYLLFFLFILFSGNIFPQKIDLCELLSPVISNIKTQYPILSQNTLKIEKFNIDLDNENIEIFLSKAFENIPYREKNTRSLYDSIRSFLPELLKTYDIQIFISQHPIEELIPNFYRTTLKTDKERIPPILPENNSIVKNESKPYQITKGLGNKHLAIWHSHGWYYDPMLNIWQWQRPRLFQIVEDTYTMSYTIPYLIPMLENAGATVFVPRERDTQLNEVIVDNDEENTFFYEETNGSKEIWEKGDSCGFANTKEIYAEQENPFLYGTYRQIKTRKNGNAYAEWIPDIPEKGTYAVYIAYYTLSESTKDAHYTVYHSGGETEFTVNQTMGGGTWIYLGSFDFDKGINPETGKVKLINIGTENDKILTADAVRFGGGFSNIARTKNIPQKSKQIAETNISGKARFLEGARYWLQWAGYHDSIYNKNDYKNDYKDDYMCRGAWINNLIGGSVKAPNLPGKNIPIDASLGFHSDAGKVDNDSIIGTMSIYMTETNNGVYLNGQKRMSSRDFADIVQTEIVNDIQTYFRPNWTRRKITDQSYNEARVPEIPTILLELLSHQNYADMKYGLDPNFRFLVSRAVYKGILKFLSSQYGTDYVVQPLPVTHFSAEFMNEKGSEVFLSWREQPDSLEPTAKADKYIVYTSFENGGFNNGIVTNEPYIILPIEQGKIYNFKITAVNEGGESFPSEILSACKLPDTQKTILIINGFNRISAPESFDNGLYAGFLDNIDQGVPDKFDISYTGSQYVHKKNVPFKTNNNPGYGASYADFENDIIAGNSFHFPYTHGKSIRNAGYSFISCSDESVTSGYIDPKKYFGIDLILGEEKETLVGKEKKYKIFQAPIRETLTEYLQNEGNLFVSGSYIGSDIWNKEECNPEEIEFAENILRYKWKQSNASKSGKVSNFFSIFPEFQTNYSFCTFFNRNQYTVEAPDAIETINGSSDILTYEDNNLTACIGYIGKYKTIIAAFPFEAIETDEARNTFMKEIMIFFENKK